jgi:hypothetical protein
MYGSRAPQGAQYYCRGCGEKLPPECHAEFHPECLKADKRRRTQEKRRLENERLMAWLERQKCPTCGSAMRQDLNRAKREPSPAELNMRGVPFSHRINAGPAPKAPQAEDQPRLSTLTHD